MNNIWVWIPQNKKQNNTKTSVSEWKCNNIKEDEDTEEKVFQPVFFSSMFAK